MSIQETEAFTPQRAEAAGEHERLQARYHVVLAEHHVKNIDPIMEEITGKPVLIVEYSGTTVEERQEALEHSRRLLAMSPSDPGLQASVAVFKDEYGPVDEDADEHLLVAIVGRLAGSGKQLFFVDIADTDPRYDAVNVADEAASRFWTTLHDGTGNLTKIEECYDEHVRTKAHSNAVREEAIVEDVRAIDKQIGATDAAIVLGKTHALVADVLAAEGDVSRVYVDSTSQSDTEHTPDTNLRRQLRLDPNAVIPVGAWRRGLLEYIDLSLTRDWTYAVDQARTLSDAEVEASILKGVQEISERARRQHAVQDPDL
jgi:hypothetical protein